MQTESVPFPVDEPGRTGSLDPVLRAPQSRAERPAAPRPAPGRTVEPAPRDAEPEVHIHIGTIEVRAIAPQPESKPRRREAPATPSLSDFLRSRETRR